MRKAACLLAMIVASAAIAQSPAASQIQASQIQAPQIQAVQIQARPAGDAQKLDAILDQARARLDQYLRLLPNIIGMEAGRSQEFHGEKQKRDVRFTAHIRMVHAPLPTAADRVTERMEFLTLNGKAVRRRPTDIPFYLVDIFSNQNPQILPSADRCILYSQQLSPPGTIRIERWIHPRNPAFAADCANNPDVNIGEKVEITLDAATMQMIELDRPLQPRRDLHRGEQLAYRYEYAPQKLGAITTLLPARLHAELVSSDEKSHKVFDASYGDYRRYGSTATVLPVQ